MLELPVAHGMPRLRRSETIVPSDRLTRREHDGIHDRDNATFWLREGQGVIRPNHARDDRCVGHVRIAVAHVRHRAVAPNDEANCHATLQARVAPEAVFVAEAKPTVVLANDALNDLGRETPLDFRRPDADLRCARGVRSTGAAVAGAEARTRSGAAAVVDGADRAETDALAEAPTASTRRAFTRGSSAVRFPSPLPSPPWRPGV